MSNIRKRCKRRCYCDRRIELETLEKTMRLWCRNRNVLLIGKIEMSEFLRK